MQIAGWKFLSSRFVFLTSSPGDADAVLGSTSRTTFSRPLFIWELTILAPTQQLTVPVDCTLLFPPSFPSLRFSHLFFS